MRCGGSWLQQAKFFASDAVAYDQFVFSVVLLCTVALVGAYNHDADKVLDDRFCLMRAIMPMSVSSTRLLAYIELCRYQYASSARPCPDSVSSRLGSIFQL